MKSSPNERLSEQLLNVDQKIVADAFEIDDAKKLKEYIKLNSKEAKKPFYITTTFKRATAIAACLAIVAVTAFALTNKTNKNINSNNNSETSSQNKKVIYVTGDTPDELDLDISTEKSLHGIYISPALQEKIDLYKDYKDAEVIYRVIVQLFYAKEDIDQGDKLADADKEAQLLFKQVEAAYLEEQKAWAEYGTFCEANPGNEPEVIEKCKEFVAIIEAKEKTADDLKSKWEKLRRETIDKYVQEVWTERLKFAAQFSEKEPVATSYSKLEYYMDLTAEEINILAEKGGYTFRLSSNDPVGVDAQ